jgi:hypothetical protein
MYKTTARHLHRSPVHPCHHHIRLISANLSGKSPSGDQIKHATKGQLNRLDPAPPQRVGAVRVVADDHPLRLPGTLQGNGKTCEERFRATMPRASHRL